MNTDKKQPDNKKPIYGRVELKNGITIPWLQFSVSESEAIRVVTGQHGSTVIRCWVTPGQN